MKHNKPKIKKCWCNIYFLPCITHSTLCIAYPNKTTEMKENNVRIEKFAFKLFIAMLQNFIFISLVLILTTIYYNSNFFAHFFSSFSVSLFPIFFSAVKCVLFWSMVTQMRSMYVIGNMSSIAKNIWSGLTQYLYQKVRHSFILSISKSKR